MKRTGFSAILIFAGAVAVFGGSAIFAQDRAKDKYTLEVPGGLAFAEFRGYESWPVIAVSENG
ncbi:MAG TPA: cytochrome P460, partial [Xanthobacteraceae bacterium]|nr:cytochrome P460 [Xanthobacteraceae bacterium]